MRPRRLRGSATRPAVVAMAIIAIALAGCGPEASSGPSAATPTGPAGPSGLESPGSTATGSTPPASASPAAPTASPKPAGLALQANVAVRVSVSVLNVRESPSTSAKKVGTMASGDVAVLLGYGGIKSGGYVWFQAGRVKGVHGALPALPANPTAGGDWTNLTGWIAVGSSTTAYVTTLAPRCDPAAATDLGILSAMLPGEQLACLGKTPLVLQGTWGCGGCGGAFPGTFKPDWLATPLSGFFSVKWSQPAGPLQLYFPTGDARPDEGKILKVHAHLGDSHSATCKISIPTSEAFDAPLVPIRTADAVLYCKQHVVVDSYDVLGVDPSFTPS